MAPPPLTETELLAALDQLGIPHHTVHHPPVRTVEEARLHRVDHEGVHVKNLFLRDKKGAMWLLVVPEELPVDLRSLRDALGCSGGPSFASHDRLRTHLGVEPGAVTPLAAINDRNGLVTVVLHQSLAAAPRVHCHPLHNAATTALSGPDLVRFLQATGHEPRFIG
jgi:Ala-tRNA(Pro) deacylase